MDDKSLDLIKQIEKKRKRHKYWKNIFTTLAVAVVFCTTYALILPAITQTRNTFCGKEEHTHEDSCYIDELICGFSEELLEEESNVEYHMHDESCYSAEKTLVCPLIEGEGHTHTEECRQVEQICICTLEEGEEHVHEEACYESRETLICELEEIEAHVHIETCYETVNQLSCEKEEIIPPESHMHSEQCYERKQMCGLEEHVHVLECCSDKTADIETEEDWEKGLPEELTGVWADDLLAVARTQLGYHESTANYEVTEDNETKGYTRYGDWYGDNYGDWCAMFVSFCLHYAEIPESAMGYEANCQNWVELLQEREIVPEKDAQSEQQIVQQEKVITEIVEETKETGEATTEIENEIKETTEDGNTEELKTTAVNGSKMETVTEPDNKQYKLSGTYIPKPGDLIFFEVSKEDWANHVGIVTEVRQVDETEITGEEEVFSEVDTIEGNSGDEVREKTYRLDDESILGYGILPNNPEMVELQEPDSTKDNTDILQQDDSSADTTEESDDLNLDSPEGTTEKQQLPEGETEAAISVHFAKYSTDTGNIISTLIAGAELALYRQEECDTFIDGTEVSGVLIEEWTSEMAVSEMNGIHRMELSDGTYYLIEKKAPEAHIGLTGPIIFQVNSTDNRIDIIQYPNYEEILLTENESGGFNFPIYNISTYRLPDTGGIGTNMFTIGGAILVIVSLLAGYIMIRKRERRVHEPS